MDARKRHGAGGATGSPGAGGRRRAAGPAAQRAAAEAAQGDVDEDVGGDVARIPRGGQDGRPRRQGPQEPRVVPELPRPLDGGEAERAGREGVGIGEIADAAERVTQEIGRPLLEPFRHSLDELVAGLDATTTTPVAVPLPTARRTRPIGALAAPRAVGEAEEENGSDGAFHSRGS